MPVSDDLRAKVRRKLNITWDDVTTESRVSDIIDDGIITLRHKLGTPDGYDFEASGQEQNLLLAWCLYEWNHAVDEFDVNYLNDILQIRHKFEVLAYEQEQAAGEVTDDAS